MKKIIVLTVLLFEAAQFSFAQNTIAKLKFESAEESFSDGNYGACFQKLSEAEKIFEKSNPPITHLRILTLDKLLQNDLKNENRNQSIEHLALLIMETDLYMKIYAAIAEAEEKTREVFKVQEKYESAINDLRKKPEVIDIVKLAYSGNVEAAYKLGLLYQGDKQIESALIWYLKASEKGSYAAMVKVYELKLYLKYMKGYSKESAEKLAFEYLIKASNAGYPNAWCILGKRFSQDKDGAEGKIAITGRDLLLKALDKGVVDAYYSLGKLYENGAKLINIDLNKAVEYFRKGAEMGGINSLKEMGYRYKKGKGVSQDYAKAMRYYENVIAKEPDDAMTYFDLGSFYNVGNGVAKNNSKALEIYKNGLAANKIFYREFALNAGKVYYEGGYGVTQDYGKALEYFIQAEEYPICWNYIGEIHENGYGVIQNYPMAMEWYLKAAEDEPVAMRNIARLYEKGLGVKKDKSLAQEWYYKAAEKEKSIK